QFRKAQEAQCSTSTSATPASTPSVEPDLSGTWNSGDQGTRQFKQTGNTLHASVDLGAYYSHEEWDGTVSKNPDGSLQVVLSVTYTSSDPRQAAKTIRREGRVVWDADHMEHLVTWTDDHRTWAIFNN